MEVRINASKPLPGGETGAGRLPDSGVAGGFAALFQELLAAAGTAGEHRSGGEDVWIGPLGGLFSPGPVGAAGWHPAVMANGGRPVPEDAEQGHLPETVTALPYALAAAAGVLPPALGAVLNRGGAAGAAGEISAGRAEVWPGGTGQSLAGGRVLVQSSPQGGAPADTACAAAAERRSEPVVMPAAGLEPAGAKGEAAFTEGPVPEAAAGGSGREEASVPFRAVSFGERSPGASGRVPLPGSREENTLGSSAPGDGRTTPAGTPGEPKSVAARGESGLRPAGIRFTPAEQLAGRLAGEKVSHFSAPGIITEAGSTVQGTELKDSSQRGLPAEELGSTVQEIEPGLQCHRSLELAAGRALPEESGQSYRSEGGFAREAGAGGGNPAAGEVVFERDIPPLAAAGGSDEEGFLVPLRAVSSGERSPGASGQMPLPGSREENTLGSLAPGDGRTTPAGTPGEPEGAAARGESGLGPAGIRFTPAEQLAGEKVSHFSAPGVITEAGSTVQGTELKDSSQRGLPAEESGGAVQKTEPGLQCHRSLELAAGRALPEESGQSYRSEGGFAREAGGGGGSPAAGEVVFEHDIPPLAAAGGSGREEASVPFRAVSFGERSPGVSGRVPLPGSREENTLGSLAPGDGRTTPAGTLGEPKSAAAQGESGLGPAGIRFTPAEQLAGRLAGEIVRWQAREAGGTYRITLKLWPRHLGDLTVSIAAANGRVSAQFYVSTPGAAGAVEASLGQLREMLAESGFELAGAGVYVGQEGGSAHGRPVPEKYSRFKEGPSVPGFVREAALAGGKYRDETPGLVNYLV